jgi:hypothetical protein
MHYVDKNIIKKKLIIVQQFLLYYRLNFLYILNLEYSQFRVQHLIAFWQIYHNIQLN